MVNVTTANAKKAIWIRAKWVNQCARFFFSELETVKRTTNCIFIHRMKNCESTKKLRDCTVAFGWPVMMHATAAKSGPVKTGETSAINACVNGVLCLFVIFHADGKCITQLHRMRERVSHGHWLLSLSECELIACACCTRTHELALFIFWWERVRCIGECNMHSIASLSTLYSPLSDAKQMFLLIYLLWSCSWTDYTIHSRCMCCCCLRREAHAQTYTSMAKRNSRVGRARPRSNPLHWLILVCDCAGFHSRLNHGASIWGNNFNGSENVPHTCTSLQFFRKQLNKKQEKLHPIGRNHTMHVVSGKTFFFSLLAFSMHSGADSTKM